MHGRFASWLVVGIVLCLTGCVERRFVIQTDPPGALVYQNGRPLGASPVDVQYTYYGDYAFTIVKDGYETLHVLEEVRAPIYAYPPIDFVVENLYPGNICDVRRLHYVLRPRPQPRLDDLLQAGQQLRLRGRQLPPPSSPTANPATPTVVTPAPSTPTLPAPATPPVRILPPVDRSLPDPSPVPITPPPFVPENP